MDSIGSIRARAADLDHAALEMIDMYLSDCMSDGLIETKRVYVALLNVCIARSSI